MSDIAAGFWQTYSAVLELWEISLIPSQMQRVFFLGKRRPSSLELRRISKQSMEFAFIDTEKGHMSLSRLCAFASQYQWLFCLEASRPQPPSA